VLATKMQRRESFLEIKRNR